MANLTGMTQIATQCLAVDSYLKVCLEVIILARRSYYERFF